MRYIGNLKAVYRDYAVGKWIAQFELDNAPSFPTDKILTVEVKEYRKKRSLTMNGYYWSLLNQYSEWSRKSQTHLHNELLARLGIGMDVDGEPQWLVMRDSIDWTEITHIHLKPTSQVKTGRNGETYRTFLVLKPSHEFDTMEYARLIDLLIQDIEGSNAPIRTLTPRELAGLEYERNMEKN